MIHDITYSTIRLIIIEAAHENDHCSAYGDFFYQFGQKIHELKCTHNSTAKSKCALDLPISPKRKVFQMNIFTFQWNDCSSLIVINHCVKSMHRIMQWIHVKWYLVAVKTEWEKKKFHLSFLEVIENEGENAT